MRSTCLALLSCVGLIACGAEKVQTELSSRVDEIVQEAIDVGEAAGISVAVYRGEEPLHVRAYGLADLEEGRLATSETPFNIGSVTKLFTSAALLTLVDSGRVSLEDSVASWVPGALGPDQGERIRVAHLVNHTSGLGEYVQADLARWERTGEPLYREFVLDFLRDRDLDYEPGSHWAYTNSGFFLAGLVIEAASGESWADYLDGAVLEPLGLSETGLCDDVVNTRTRGYEVGNEGLEPAVLYIEAGLRGDGGLCTSARDLAKFATGLDRGRILSADIRARMLSPTALPSGSTVDYGLGARLGQLEGRRLWGHTGGHAGTIAVVARYPSEDLTIAVQTNTIRSDFDALVLEGRIAAAILDVSMSAPDTLPADVEELERYVGEYRGEPDEAPRVVSIRDGELHETASHGRRAWRLLPIGESTFVRENDPYPLDRYVFELRDGRAISYSAFYNGFHGAFFQRVP